MAPSEVSGLICWLEKFEHLAAENTRRGFASRTPSPFVPVPIALIEHVEAAQVLNPLERIGISRSRRAAELLSDHLEEEERLADGARR